MGKLNKGIIILMAAVALAAGFWFSSSLDRQSQLPLVQIQGFALPVPRTIALPPLIKDDGTAFTRDDLAGNWTLVFFGYTHCPDICPTTMGVLAQAKKKAQGTFPRVVFISVDPQRDTAELLKEYVKYFDPEFIGVSGTESMIRALTLQMSVLYLKTPGDSGNKDDYQVDHSSALLLLNPEGQLEALLQAPHTPASILDSVNKVVHR